MAFGGAELERPYPAPPWRSGLVCSVFEAVPKKDNEKVLAEDRAAPQHAQRPRDRAEEPHRASGGALPGSFCTYSCYPTLWWLLAANLAQYRSEGRLCWRQSPGQVTAIPLLKSDAGDARCCRATLGKSLCLAGLGFLALQYEVRLHQQFSVRLGTQAGASQAGKHYY